MIRSLEREDGFTLIELALVGAIIVAVLAIMLNVLSAGTEAERTNELRSRTASQLRTASARVTKDVRQALWIDPASTPTRLSMRTISSGVEHLVVWDVSGGRLRRAVDGGTPVPVATGIASGNLFCYDPPACLSSVAGSSLDMVRLRFVSLPPAAGSRALEVVTEVELRNL